MKIKNSLGLIALISISLSSCGLLEPVKVTQLDTVSEKMYNCVLELVGKHGVGADKATEACERIYKVNR